MEMVINGRERKVLSCHVQYARFDNREFYIVVVGCSDLHHRLEYFDLLITSDPDKAWTKCLIVREAIETDKKGTVEVD